MKLIKLHSEVVKRGRRYLVIVRKEIRVFGRVLWAGPWLQARGSHTSRIEALRHSVELELGKVKH